MILSTFTRVFLISIVSINAISADILTQPNANVDFYDPRIESSDETTTSGEKQSSSSKRVKTQTSRHGVKIITDSVSDSAEIGTDAYAHNNLENDLTNPSATTNTNTTYILTPEILREYTPLTSTYGINQTTHITPAQLQTFQRSGSSGNSESLYFLGLANLYGLSSLPANAIKASKYFSSAAQLGFADAQCALGLLLYRGYGGVGRDTKAAVLWFRLAAEQGSKEGLWLLGRAYYEGRVDLNMNMNDQNEKSVKGKERYMPDHSEAARLFGLAAEKGSLEAVHHLAVQFEYGLISNGEEPKKRNINNNNGKGKDKDNESKFENPLNSPQALNRPHVPNFVKASVLYKEAFSKGHIDSGYNLALLHAYGRGLEQNYNKALSIFAKLALEHDYVPSMLYMGIFYTHGHGLKDDIPDYKRALIWFDKCELFEDGRVSGKCSGYGEELRRLVGLAEGKVKEVSGRFGDEFRFDFEPW